LFPGKLLPCTCRVVDGVVVPRFLGPSDHPWLRVLLGEFARFEGQPRRELDRRLKQPPPCYSPRELQALASHVLLARCTERQRPVIRPAAARAALFTAGTRLPDDHDRAWAEAAAGLDVTVEVLRDALFADLAGERRVVAPPQHLSPDELALRTNLAITRTILFRSSQLTIELFGNARSVVRYAHLRGLICTVTPSEGDDACQLQVSGPYTLFRRTLVYGRALADLVPRLAWCHRFRLVADCVIDEQQATFTLQSGDPIFPGKEPRPYDSTLERRFARDFARLATDWDLVHEPEPIDADGTLIFPDFALWRRDRPDRRWLLEIVGFWTPDYLHHKLTRLRAAGLDDLVLCIDAERDCATEDVPESAHVIRYRRRIDAKAVLRVLVENRQPVRERGGIS
jgi:uncharacterized protein